MPHPTSTKDASAWLAIVLTQTAYRELERPNHGHSLQRAASHGIAADSTSVYDLTPNEAVASDGVSFGEEVPGTTQGA